MRRALLAAALASHAHASVVQCPSPTTDGCGLPTGANWAPRWAMRSSIYAYCFEVCPLAYFEAHKSLGVFDGVVACDHYWTHQGMPCVDGVPVEFAAQDNITRATKASFPGARVIQYRIGTAVPYDAVVHTAMVDHPEWFVRWRESSVARAAAARAAAARADASAPLACRPPPRPRAQRQRHRVHCAP